MIVVLFIVVLLKCATGQAPLRKTVEIDEDIHEKAIVVIGIEERIGSPKSLNYFFIRSFIFKDSGNVMHQICADYGYTGKEWEFYTKAYSQEGQPLQCVKIDSNVTRYESINVYYEAVGVTIADDYIRNHLNGFSIKVSAKSGDSFTVEPTPKQIKSQLAKIQEYKKLHGL
ncbi:hypothetical protein JW879_08125 [candidate division WOR-3 bacterium]|nr:hypothetical protein [candidate division WOR-3 bacterium]